MAPSLWIKLSVDFYTNPKVLAAGNEATTLWIRGLCHSKVHMGDGFVPSTALPFLAFGLGDSAELCGRLVDANLWEAVPGGFTVGAERWAEWQQTKEDLERKSKAGAKAAAARWNPDRNAECNAVGNADRMRIGMQEQSRDRVETEKEQKLSSAGSASGTQSAPSEVSDPLSGRDRLSKLYAAIVIAMKAEHKHVKIPVEGTRPWAQWRNSLRLLVDADGFDEETVESVMRWLWKSPEAAFWRENVQAIPPLRVARSGDQSKFLKIEAKWRASTIGSRPPDMAPPTFEKVTWRDVFAKNQVDILPQWETAFMAIERNADRACDIAGTICRSRTMLAGAVLQPELLTPSALKAIWDNGADRWPINPILNGAHA